MLKFFTEIAPLIAFLIGYKMEGIFTATLYMLVLSVIALTVNYAIERKINKVALISTIILIASASLTLLSGNTVFIKMKPTILYLVFGTGFLITEYRWQPAIKYLFQSAIQLKEEKYWYELNTRFVMFFFLMAGLNELVWRNFSESSWVYFKVFGVLPITLIFSLSQIPFLIRHKVEDPKIDDINLDA